MLNFWETVRGARLADTLIRELPKLTEQKKQKLCAIAGEDDVTKLSAAISKGSRVVTSFTVDGTTFVVMEES